MEQKAQSGLPNLILLKVPDFLYSKTKELAQTPDTRTFGELRVSPEGKVGFLRAHESITKEN